MEATGSIDIAAPAEKIFDFVLDPKGYPQVDRNIQKIELLDERTETTLKAKVRGYVRFPFLASSIILNYRLAPYERIELESEAGSVSFPGSLLLDGFKASFVFEKEGEGTRVTHLENYQTKATLLGRLEEWLTGNWLKQHMQGELARLKEIVEAQQ